MQNFIFRIALFSLVLQFGWAKYVSGQANISGPTTAHVNSTHTYILFEGSGNIRWVDPAGGNIISYGPGNQSVTIQWTQTGIFELRAYYGTIFDPVQLSVTVVTPLQGGTIGSLKPSWVYGEEMEVLTNVTPSTGGACAAPNSSLSVSYLWEYSYDNVVFNYIPGATSLEYKAKEPITRKTYYRRRAYCSSEVVFSNTVTVNIQPLLVAGRIASSQAISPSGTPVALTGVDNPGGGTGTFTYQWEQSLDGLAWSLINGATGSSYQPPSLSQNTFYRRKVMSDVQTRYSNTVKILVGNNVAQNKPTNTVINPSEPERTIPGYTGITSNHLNKVSQYDISRPGITNEAQVLALTQRTDFKKTTAYIDGIGRTLQYVLHKSSTSGKDIIDFSVYDKFGKQTIKFLPYPASTDQNNEGSFRANIASEQEVFYNGLTQNTEGYFYSAYQAEQSEFSRVSQVMAPGKSFAGQKSGNREETRISNTFDNIRLWNIGDEEGAFPVSSGEYSSGRLTVNVHTTTQEETVTTYIDSKGNTVCTSLKSGITDKEDEGIRTYYVYNDLGQLRYIITPQAVKYCKANNVWDLNASTATRAVAKELCYKYYYNAKGWLIQKQLPGVEGGAEYFIYDSKGRLVFAQNSLMRATNPGQWILYFYDELDRLLITALYTNPSATYASLEAMLNTPSGNVSIVNTLPPIKDLYIDARDVNVSKYEATNSINILPGFETEAGANITFEVSATPTPRTETFIVNNPAPNISGYEVLVVLYYDNYDWSGAQPFSTAFQNIGGSNPYVEAVTPRRIAAGKLTGIRRAVKEKGLMLSTTIYYDEFSREIQSHSENIAGGVDVYTTQYDFSGKVVSGYVHHKNPQSVNTPELKILTKFAYENGDQLKEVRHTLAGQAGMSEKLLNWFTYDERGAVKTQSLGNLETLNFDYTLQGNLSGINAGYSRNKGDQHYFGMEIFYDKGFESIRKDGGISGVTWRRRGNGDEAHAYGYKYDHAGRLTKADYTQNTAGTWSNDLADFKVAIPAYDDNGNIKQMSQDGMLLGNVKAVLDNLVYQYENNEYSNRLRSVTDDKGNQQQGDFKDFNNGGADYVYDVEGNLIKDRNRGISISYDYLVNKPTKISLDDDPGKSIEYVYSISGDKLQQIVKSDGVTTTYSYINGFIYKNNELMLFPHFSGRVRRNANSQWVYDYFIQDHVGNVRTVITEETNVIPYRATHEVTPQPAPPVPERDVFNFTIEPENIPVGHKFYDYAGTNRKFIKLNGNTPERRIGTSKVLRVMAGDNIEVGVMSYYAQNSPDNNVPNQPVNQILSQLVNAFLGSATTVVPNGHGNLLQSTSNGTVLNTQDISSFISTNQSNNPSSQVPKAYLNYVLFDDNFKMVTGGALRVSQPDAITPLAAQLSITKNGYVYVYPSNESPTDVYFDDLIVKHTTGHLLQEDSYYPFGLSIRALSSKALNREKNNYLFNGIEKLSEFDLEIYDAFYRNLDPQIGRWWQRDPASEKYASHSPYNLSGNNPINYSDPLGDDWYRGRGDAYIWLESTDATAVINGELWEHIGPVLQTTRGGLSYLFMGKDLTAIGFDGQDASAILYNNGQQDFVRYVYNIDPEAIAGLQRSIHKRKVEIEAAHARGIYGGVSSERVDQLRREASNELIPSIKDAYAAKLSGITPSGFGYSINPLARANYAAARASTVFTEEEGMGIFYTTGFEVATAWLGSIKFAAPHLKASTQLAKSELKNVFSTFSRGFTVDANKFNYFFGRVVTGDPGNIKRSAQNLKDLTKMGITTEKQLMEVFNEALFNGTVESTKVTSYGISIMKRVNVGNNGSIGVGFFYPGGDLNVTPSVTTIIPKTW